MSSIVDSKRTLVPENRLEITTEGGLNVAAKAEELSKAIAKLKQNDILVSVFIDPESSQVKAAKKVGADFVEFHTGKYSNAYDMGDSREVESELSAIQDMTLLAHKYGEKYKTLLCHPERSRRI